MCFDGFRDILLGRPTITPTTQVHILTNSTQLGPMKLPRICAEPNCGEIAKPGTNRCPRHPAKRSPSSRATSTSEWKRIREEALRRDAHTCQLCGDPATQVDHVISVAAGGDNSLSNARSVCAQCNVDARPGYTPRRPKNVASRLAELRGRLDSTTNSYARIELQAQIRGLEARLAEEAAEPASGGFHGLLSRPERREDE
jgi:5-methylcytosine-specific restriction protein A